MPRPRVLRHCAVLLCQLIGTALAPTVWATTLVQSGAGTQVNSTATLSAVTASLSRTLPTFMAQDATSSASITVDPVSKTVHATTSLAVNDYTCLTSNCLVQSDNARALVRDSLYAFSASSGNHVLDIILKPTTFEGSVTTTGIYGFPTAAVYLLGSIVASVPSTPATFIDNFPKTLSYAADVASFAVDTHSNGIRLSVPNGTSIDLSWAWQLSVGLYQGGIANGVTPHASGTITADFSHTGKWGGLFSVTDTSTGKPVTDLQLSSALGVDWAKPSSAAPVPEPASWALWLLGLISLMPLGLRRRIGVALDASERAPCLA